MPTITRWFNVTHDINADPEMWELREKFTDRAGFIWLECLSIADRNSGVVGPVSDQTRNHLASKCRTSRAKVASVLGWCRTKGWLRFGTHIEVSKWSKYNKTRGVNISPSYPNPPNPPNLLKEVAETATLPAEKKTKRNQEIERIFTMAKEIAGRDKDRAKQLCDFVGKTIKGGIKFGDSEQVVHAAIIDTFQMLKAKAEKDRHPIEEVLLWPYLQTTYKYRRTTELTRESDRYKKADIGSFGEILDQIKVFKSA